MICRAAPVWSTITLTEWVTSSCSSRAIPSVRPATLPLALGLGDRLARPTLRLAVRGGAWRFPPATREPRVGAGPRRWGCSPRRRTQTATRPPPRAASQQRCACRCRRLPTRWRSRTRSPPAGSTGSAAPLHPRPLSRGPLRALGDTTRSPQSSPAAQPPGPGPSALRSRRGPRQSARTPAQRRAPADPASGLGASTAAGVTRAECTPIVRAVVGLQNDTRTSRDRCAPAWRLSSRTGVGSKSAATPTTRPRSERSFA